MGVEADIEANKAVIRRWVEVTNAHDMDALVELFTPDTFDHVGGRSGADWWRQVFGFLYATLPDWQWTLDDLIAEGDRVVARLTVRGTHLGSEIPFLRGVAPTGKPVAWTHHHSFRLEDGRIAEHWANRDDLGFLRQVTSAGG
jgi:predicted ester cyclase